MQHPSTTPLTEDLGETIGYIEAYLEKNIQLAKLNAAEKVAALSATFATAFLIISMLPIIICMLSIGFGFFLVQTLGWTYAQAFFSIAGIYVFLTIVLVLCRRIFITNPILSVIIKELLK